MTIQVKKIAGISGMFDFELQNIPRIEARKQVNSALAQLLECGYSVSYFQSEDMRRWDRYGHYERRYGHYTPGGEEYETLRAQALLSRRPAIDPHAAQLIDIIEEQGGLLVILDPMPKATWDENWNKA